MYLSPFPQEMPGNAQTDLFPSEWLAAEPVRTIINAAPTGVALLKAVRGETGQITDFQYQMANLMQRALMNHPEEDPLHHSLVTLSPDVVETGLLTRLIQVVATGQPSQHVESYHLDGVVGRYDQLYIKSGDGVLVLVQDVTYRPLSVDECYQQATFLEAVQTNRSVGDSRLRLVALISGQGS